MSLVRVDPAVFRKLDLRCHSLLCDVPLHDAWAIPLEDARGERTIDDVRTLVFDERRPPLNAAVRALFGLRWWLGQVFGWDDARHDPRSTSYLHRLTEGDRLQSRVPPGTRDGRSRVLYVFDRESVSEIRNATVHGFLATALVPRNGGYVLYVGIYVKPVSRFTALYMTLIHPFRRFVVYPALGRYVQQAWLRTST
jgi:hypothetical protein